MTDRDGTCILNSPCFLVRFGFSSAPWFHTPVVAFDCRPDVNLGRSCHVEGGILAKHIRFYVENLNDIEIDFNTLTCVFNIWCTVSWVQSGVIAAGIRPQAAQAALDAASRRRALAMKVVDPSIDKRSRPPATNSTKVTPEGKKPCASFRSDDLEPRSLSFSSLGESGEGEMFPTNIN